MRYVAESNNDVCSVYASAAFELNGSIMTTGLPVNIVLNGISLGSTIGPDGSRSVNYTTSISCTQSDFLLISPMIGYPPTGLEVVTTDEGIDVLYQSSVFHYSGPN